LVPGRVAPWNGQLILPDVARILLDSGVSGFVFVLAGEHRSYRKYARAVAKEAEVKGVQAFIRFTGHCRDMPAAFAAADTGVALGIGARVVGLVGDHAPAMGRPVVAPDVGILPEPVVAPPEMPDEGGTEWVAKAGGAGDFASALSEASALHETAYRTMAERA